jgi:hypothetical protein
VAASVADLNVTYPLQTLVIDLGLNWNTRKVSVERRRPSLAWRGPDLVRSRARRRGATGAEVARLQRVCIPPCQSTRLCRGSTHRRSLRYWPSIVVTQERSPLLGWARFWLPHVTLRKTRVTMGAGRPPCLLVDPPGCHGGAPSGLSVVTPKQPDSGEMPESSLGCSRDQSIERSSFYSSVHGPKYT